MKILEKLVLQNLLSEAEPHLNEMQLAYEKRRGTEDAVVTLLHKALEHLDQRGNYVCIL